MTHSLGLFNSSINQCHYLSGRGEIAFSVFSNWREYLPPLAIPIENLFIFRTERFLRSSNNIHIMNSRFFFFLLLLKSKRHSLRFQRLFVYDVFHSIHFEQEILSVKRNFFGLEMFHNRLEIVAKTYENEFRFDNSLNKRVLCAVKTFITSNV